MPISNGYMPKPGSIIRFACLLSGALLVYGLFHYGAQPIAVGLFAPPTDKIAHAGVFGLIAMMLWFVFDRRYPLLVIGLVAIVGAADEVHQLLLPGRFAEVGDWLVDVGGACLSLLVLLASRKKCSDDGIKINSLEEAGAEQTIQA